MECFLVYVTVKEEAEAALIAKTVVEERLAACANVLGGIRSIYRWEGAVCDEAEVALVFKTSGARKAELIDRINALHSYEVPCITCMAIADGYPDFLKWIVAETEK